MEWPSDLEGRGLYARPFVVLPCDRFVQSSRHRPHGVLKASDSRTGWRAGLVLQLPERSAVPGQRALLVLNHRFVKIWRSWIVRAINPLPMSEVGHSIRRLIAGR